MKKVLALTLVLLVALTIPAMAALKMLPEALALELEGIAKEYLAKEQKVSTDTLTVSEAWVRELWNIEKEVYIVVLTHGDKKTSVHIDVATKAALSDKEFKALVDEDLASDTGEPVFRTMSIDIEADGEVVVTAAPKKNSNLPYLIGAGLVIGLGAGTFVLKGRFSN